MGDSSDKGLFEFEMLKRYGARWAVLAAMTARMAQKGIDVPRDVFESAQKCAGEDRIRLLLNL